MNQQVTLDLFNVILNTESTEKLVQQNFYQAILAIIALVNPQKMYDQKNTFEILIDQMHRSLSTPYLDQKSIIGFGGGFSAGKSRFLNTFLGIDNLPEALEPCTAVATYIGYNKTSCYLAKNTFQQNLRLSEEQIKNLSHLFDAASNENAFKLGRLLEHVYIGLDDFKWANLAFLDTPGYSKADSQHNDQTDEKIALEQLKQVDHIVWLVSAKNGTIREDDLNFLVKIHSQQSIFIVVTQSDLVSSVELPSIIATIKNSLQREHIEIAGIMAWAAPIHTQQGHFVVGDDIYAWLKNINTYPEQKDEFNQFIKFIDDLKTDLEIQVEDLHQSILDQQQLRKKLPVELSIQFEESLEQQNIQQELFETYLDQLQLMKSSLYFDYGLVQLKQGVQQNAIDNIASAAILSLPQALEWLKTEKHHSVYIQYVLAKMYENGEGVEKNLNYAIDQYIEILKSGYEYTLTDILKWVNNQHHYAIQQLATYYEEHENDVIKAEEYHNILVRKFYSEASLEWYYQKALDHKSVIFEYFKKLAKEYKHVSIDFTYAKILFAHGNIDDAMQIMSKNISNTSVRIWLEKHEDTCSQVQFQIAKMYALGLCYKQDLSLAINKYDSLIEKNYLPAIDSLLELAIKNKRVDAYIILAKAYEFKLNNFNLAIDYYVEAIKLVSPQALLWLIQKAKQELPEAVGALRDLSRNSTRPEIQSAYVKYLETSAKIEDPAQAISLEAVNFKNKIAYEWIKSYAEKGNKQAQWYFIDFYKNKIISSTTDRILLINYCYDFAVSGENKAVVALQEITENDAGHASYILGLVYAFGYAVEQDLKKASHYFEKAHRNGFNYASYNFAAIPNKSNKKPYVLLKYLASQNVFPAKKITSFPANILYVLGLLRPKPVDFHLNKTKYLRINWLILFIYFVVIFGFGFTSYKHPEILHNIKNSVVSLWMSEEIEDGETYIVEDTSMDLGDIYNHAELITTFYPNSDKDNRVQGIYEYQNLGNETRYLVPILSNFDDGKNVCNACQAPIDFFVFKKQGKGYQLVARNETNTILTIGHGTDNSMIRQLSGNVIEFGPNKQGLLLTSRWGGSGHTAEDPFLILIDEYAGVIRNIAEESMTLEEGEGYIDTEYTSKYHFDKSSEHKGIYDFIIEQEGTALNENREVIPHHRKLTYHYGGYQFELFKEENLLVSESEHTFVEKESSNGINEDVEINNEEALAPILPDSKGIEWSRQPRIGLDRYDLNGMSHQITVEIEANENGIIENVSIIKSTGIEALDMKVVRAVKAAKFKTFIQGGKAVGFKVQQEFKLG